MMIIMTLKIDKKSRAQVENLLIGIIDTAINGSVTFTYEIDTQCGKFPVYIHATDDCDDEGSNVYAREFTAEQVLEAITVAAKECPGFPDIAKYLIAMLAGNTDNVYLDALECDAIMQALLLGTVRYS